MEEAPQGLESALNAAFSDAPPPQKQAPKPQRTQAVQAPEPEPVEIETPEEPTDAPEADPADLLDGVEPIEDAPEAPPSEPEFEIEVDGKPEVIRGNERVKELIQRGLKAGRGFEENARVREALQAHVQQTQLYQGFQQAIAGDLQQLQGLEAQLKQYEQVDWQKEYDTDPFNALKLKEQRDQLREQRAAFVQDLNAKQQQYQAQFQQNAQRVLAAEQQALLAKIPAWRNAEKAKQEQGEIVGALTSHYGFTPAEVSQLIDHRHVLLARDAAAYRKLLAAKDSRVKQAREAPATAKPGAAAVPTNGRTEFNKVRGKIKELGSKGNHKAQEELATKLISAAFK